MSGQDKFEDMADLCVHDWYVTVPVHLANNERLRLTDAIAALVRRADEQARADEREACVGVLRKRIDKCAADNGTIDDPGSLGCDICDQLRKDIESIRALDRTAEDGHG